MTNRTCGFSGCGNPHAARGYCLGHYQQLKAGRELKPLRSRTYWNGAKCAVPEDGKPCGRDIVARGYCGKHFQRWNKTGDPASKPERMKQTPVPCSECGEPVHARGYCSSHHARWYKYGDPNYVPPRRLRATCTAFEDGRACGQPAQGNGYCSKHNRRFKVHGDPSVVLPPRSSGYRKYAVNEAYFDEITASEQAYWLGFIAADGSVTSSGRDFYLRVELKRADAGHLFKLRSALGSDAPVRPTKQNCASLTVHSKHLVESLTALGIIERKSLVVAPPLEKLTGLEVHYWRGLWDGDGHVSVRRNRRAGWHIGIVGSLACVDGFASWACRISGSKATPNNNASKNPRVWQWGVGGTRMPWLLAEQLRLAGTGFGLDRKQVLLDDVCAFDLSEHEARWKEKRGVFMRELWASGRHPRAKR